MVNQFQNTSNNLLAEAIQAASGVPFNVNDVPHVYQDTSNNLLAYLIEKLQNLQVNGTTQNLEQVLQIGNTTYKDIIGLTDFSADIEEFTLPQYLVVKPNIVAYNLTENTLIQNCVQALVTRKVDCKGADVLIEISPKFESQLFLIQKVDKGREIVTIKTANSSIDGEQDFILNTMFDSVLIEAYLDGTGHVVASNIYKESTVFTGGLIPQRIYGEMDLSTSSTFQPFDFVQKVYVDKIIPYRSFVASYSRNNNTGAISTLVLQNNLDLNLTISKQSNGVYFIEKVGGGTLFIDPSKVNLCVNMNAGPSLNHVNAKLYFPTNSPYCTGIYIHVLAGTIFIDNLEKCILKIEVYN